MFFPQLETNYIAKGYIPIYLRWSRLFLSFRFQFEIDNTQTRIPVVGLGRFL